MHGRKCSLAAEIRGMGRICSGWGQLHGYVHECAFQKLVSSSPGHIVDGELRFFDVEPNNQNIK